MKKLLLICICAISLFGLKAQINEDFSDYTVGAKIAQEAQSLGYTYWTTWSSSPGGTEDGTIALFQNDKVASLSSNNDQVLLFGEKTAGIWNISFDMYVPSGKVGYFNVLADFAASSSVWAMQVYVNATNDGQNTTYAPGQGTLHAAGSAAASFTCAQEVWINFAVVVDLNSDQGTFFVNGSQIHQWQWSLGSFGNDNLRQLDAMNIYCDPASNMEFYADNFVFEAEGGSETLFSTTFDEATVGQHLGVIYPEFWTTWSVAPGTAEDAIISSDFSNSTPNSAKFAYGNDAVFKTGDKTTGSYTIDFDMYVGTGKNGYFNILHSFNGSSSEWGVEIYLNEPAEGTKYVVGGVDHTFTIPFDTWFNVHFDINLDGDWIEFYIDDALIGEWQFSLKASENSAGLRQLGAMDFYPPAAAATSVFYIDNLEYTANGGEAFPIMGVTPTSMTKSLAPGQVGSETVTVSNTGTSIGDYFSWITYDDATGASGTQTNTITYSSDVATNAVGFSNGTPLVELGAKFPGSFYGPYMNTKITQLSYYMGTYDVVGGLVFRVYDQGDYGTPGEILAEATLSTYTLSAWNTVTFTNPVLLTGRDVWVVVEFTQTAGGYPLNFDDGVGEENTDWYRTNGGAWGQFHNGANNWGNVMIKATSVGTPIPGSWATLSGTSYGSILANNSASYQVAFNAAGLSQNTYNATLHVSTNDTDNPLFNIPITLNVISSDCDVPTNLVATSNQSNMSVSLTWEGPFEGGWISWSGENNGNSIGTGGAADFSVAHRYPTSDLTNYNGMTLTKIKIVPFIASSSCTYSVRVWTGGSASGPANLVIDQELSSVTVEQWNEITLNSPVTINSAQELWFGYRCNTTTGYPAGCDDGPAVNGKGNMMYLNNAWTTLSGINPDLNYNWCIEGFVTGAKGEPIKLQPLTDNSVPTSGNLAVSRIPINKQNITNTRDNITYNVYRNGVKVAQGITETSYVDESLDAGEFCYTVTTSCSVGEGLHSNESCATLLDPCNAPVITAIGESENENPAIHILWDAVSGASTYKVYYGSTNVGTTSGTEIYITGITANTEYCFTVKTICTNGLTSVASNTACATYTSINEIANQFNVYPNPANTEVKVDGQNIDKISVYSVLGQLVEITNDNIINTASYTEGVYIFRIITKEGAVATKRVIIKH